MKVGSPTMLMFQGIHPVKFNSKIQGRELTSGDKALALRFLAEQRGGTCLVIEQEVIDVCNLQGLSLAKSVEAQVRRALQERIFPNPTPQFFLLSNQGKRHANSRKEGHQKGEAPVEFYSRFKSDFANPSPAFTLDLERENPDGQVFCVSKNGLKCAKKLIVPKKLADAVVELERPVWAHLGKVEASN